MPQSHEIVRQFSRILPAVDRRKIPRKIPQTSRQAGQETAELVQHYLLVRSIGRRLVPALPNTDRDMATRGIHDALVRGQLRAAARVDVGRGEDGARVDAAHDELEGAGRGALARDLGEVDIQEDAGREVRRAGVDDGVGQVGGEVGVDEAPRGDGGRVPGQRAVRQAREGYRRQGLLADRVARGADCARELHLQVDVGADVGARDGELGRGAAPVAGADLVDAVADRRRWERVDPVQAGVGRVGARPRVGVGRAAVVLACCRARAWV